MKSFLFKFLYFSMLLLMTQTIFTVVTWNYWEDIINAPKEITQLNNYLSHQVDMIYFGDSTLFLPPSPTPIPVLLQNKLPTDTIGALYHSAYHMDIYLSFCQYIVQSDYHPKLIIIPINLRSFSVSWDMKPGWQFETEKRIIGNYHSLPFRMVSKPISIFDGFKPKITKDIFLNTPVFSGKTQIGTNYDFENMPPDWSPEEYERNNFIRYYMYSLDKNHRKVQSMIEIAKILKENDIDLLFYITPINYQAGEQLLGNEFNQRLIENTDVIKTALIEQGVETLDLTFRLESTFFRVAEHLSEEGREIVAEEIAKQILKSSQK